MLCHTCHSCSRGICERRYNKHIEKHRNSVADSTVPETVVPRPLSQAPVILARRSRCLAVSLILCTKPLGLDSCATSWSFFPSRRSSLRVLRWSELENVPPPVTDHTSSLLPWMDLKYFSWDDVTGFRSPNSDFLNSTVLRAPTMGDMVFVFPKKIQDKNICRIIFSTPENAYPVSQVTCWRNIHSYWITRTIVL